MLPQELRAKKLQELKKHITSFNQSYNSAEYDIDDFVFLYIKSQKITRVLSEITTINEVILNCKEYVDVLENIEEV